MHHVLEGVARNKRIASAYLFVGSPESGKRENALEFARVLGCRGVDQIEIKPEGAFLKIEQIRELQRLIRYGPSVSDYLAAIVEPADTLTTEAATAFLKTLEEPPPRVVFILLVEREDRLPATIASRCQKVIFGEELRSWQPNPELSTFYEELRNIKKKNIPEILELSARLEKEKERIEELLYDLIFFVKHELQNLSFVRILLEAVKNIKKKANLKLALDVACLKMGEA